MIASSCKGFLYICIEEVIFEYDFEGWIGFQCRKGGLYRNKGVAMIKYGKLSPKLIYFTDMY